MLTSLGGTGAPPALCIMAFSLPFPPSSAENGKSRERDGGSDGGIRWGIARSAVLGHCRIPWGSSGITSDKKTGRSLLVDGRCAPAAAPLVFLV